MKNVKLKINKEYEVQNRFATLISIGEDTAVLRDRFDNEFECEIGYLKEKDIPCKKPQKKKL